MKVRPFRVYLIEDDNQIVRALSRVLALAGYDVKGFSDAELFLQQHDPEVPGCAVVDLGLPGQDGFEVQEALAACERPVIFISGRGSVSASVRAMKAGALDFLEKPIDASALIEAIVKASEVDCARRALLRTRQEFDERFARLTQRERQVLSQVVAGRMSKQIAADLGTVEKTIKVHRGRMMYKMGARTVADLVRTVQKFHS